MKRNPQSPWNPAYPVEVTPEEYEEQVVAWLRNVADSVNLTVEHRLVISGQGGEYEFDAVADLAVFGGAGVRVLVECKRIARPVEREVILAIDAKRSAVGAHKALVVSTSGFQSGALDYATEKGIACVTFIKGSWLYETKGLDQLDEPDPPPWANLPRFAGQVVRSEDGRITVRTIDDGTGEALSPLLDEAEG